MLRSRVSRPSALLSIVLGAAEPPPSRGSFMTGSRDSRRRAAVACNFALNRKPGSRRAPHPLKNRPSGSIRGARRATLG